MKKNALWYDASREWLDSFFVMLYGIIIDAIVLWKYPIHLLNRPTWEEIVEIIICIIPLVVILQRFVKTLTLQKKHFKQLDSLTDKQVMLLRKGNILEDKKAFEKRTAFISKAITYPAIVCAALGTFISVIDTWGWLNLLFGILGVMMIIGAIMAFAERVESEGFLGALGGTALDMIGEVGNTVFDYLDSVEMAQGEASDSRFMTDYSRNKYYVSGKIGDTIRYVQDQDGNEKRLHKGSGGWWDDENNFYEDIQ